MRVAVVTQEEPFYLPAFFQRVLARRARDVVAMVLPSGTAPGLARWKETARRALILYGPWDFARQSVRFTGHKLIDRLGPPRPGGRYHSVARVAAAHGVPVLRPGTVNDPAFLTQLESLCPSLVVSVSAEQIFRKELLAIPSMGCINVHSALLPRYRGLYPSFWVLANGELETGVTVHAMEEDLDGGAILLQERVAITSDETQHSLLLKTKHLGAELLLQAMEHFEAGTISPRPNDAAEATYYSFPTRADVRRFRARGKRFR